MGEEDMLEMEGRRRGGDRVGLKEGGEEVEIDSSCILRLTKLTDAASGIGVTGYSKPVTPYWSL